jgi:hypothetical protein
MGKSEEDFAKAYSDDEIALNLAAVRFSAEHKEREAKTTVLERGKEHGLGQFALYGLSLHMRESEVDPQSHLRDRVSQTEHDFEVVDRFIRENPGRLLTVLGMGVYAGRLAEGGISMDEKYNVNIPSEGACYAMSFLQGIDKLYETDRIHIATTDIHSIFGSEKVKLFESWNPLLRINEVYDVSGVTLAAGDVVEGPARIGGQKRDRDFYQMVFDKTRNVSRIAQHNS